MMRPKALLVMLALLAQPGATGAMTPPPPGAVITADQTAAALTVGNHRVGRPGHAAGSTAKATYALLGLAPGFLNGALPPVGRPKTFTLLVDFDDAPASMPAESVTNGMYGAGSPALAPTESLSAFYLRSSAGRLDLSDGSVLGWWRCPTRRSAISTYEQTQELVIKPALDHFARQGVDFSRFDNDGDGRVDTFYVVWAGAPGDWSTPWWSYEYYLFDGAFSRGGATFGAYVWMWEYNQAYGGSPTLFSPLVAIHETGHALGLPDLYDYVPGTGPDGGAGGMDMMDRLYGDHNCYSKWLLGWLTPRFHGDGLASFLLEPAGAGGGCVAVWPGAPAQTPYGEMFLVENRAPAGNDPGWLPTSGGLTVWHVDGRRDGGGFINDNSTTDSKYLKLMQADGSEAIERSGAATRGSFMFSPGRALYDGGSPSSRANSGANSGVALVNFTLSGRTMGFTAGVNHSFKGYVMTAPGKSGFGLDDSLAAARLATGVGYGGSTASSADVYPAGIGDGVIDKRDSSLIMHYALMEAAR